MNMIPKKQKIFHSLILIQYIDNTRQPFRNRVKRYGKKIKMKDMKISQKKKKKSL